MGYIYLPFDNRERCRIPRVSSAVAWRSGWLAGWKYRKPFTLSRASGAVTNYQMKLIVAESYGAIGAGVDANGCASSFNDIRFTKADGQTLLDYWIESISGTTPNQLATVWVEFDSIGTDATTFYLYYGNAGAAAVSSGANTFIVFDDFERGADGDTIGGSWTEVVAHVHLSTEQKYGGSKSTKLVGAAGTYCLATIPVTVGDIAVGMWIYKENLADCTPISIGNGSKRPILSIDSSENVTYYTGSTVDTGADMTADAWGHLEICNLNYTAGTFDIYVNRIIAKSGASMYSDALYNNAVRIQGTAMAGYDTWIDNFTVRQYLAVEPAWGTWGAQESVA